MFFISTFFFSYKQPKKINSQAEFRQSLNNLLNNLSARESFTVQGLNNLGAIKLLNLCKIGVMG